MRSLHDHYWYKRIHRRQLHKTLKLGDRLPRDLEGTFLDVPVFEFYEGYHPFTGHPIQRTEPWAFLTIVIKKGPPEGSRKSSKHRVFFFCRCNRMIPVGRSHQHLPVCKAWLEAFAAPGQELNRYEQGGPIYTGDM